MFCFQNMSRRYGMVEDFTLFQARKQVFLKQFLKRKFGAFLSEHACVVWLTRGSINLHSIFWLHLPKRLVQFQPFEKLTRAN